MAEIYLKLVFAFIRIGFCSFGGLTMIPVILDEVTANGWMTEAQVMDVMALAEITPGIFKGALEGRATAITEEMKLAAAAAIAGLVDNSDLNDENILPAAFDPRVADVVSRAVKEHIQ